MHVRLPFDSLFVRLCLRHISNKIVVVAWFGIIIMDAQRLSGQRPDLIDLASIDENYAKTTPENPRYIEKIRECETRLNICDQVSFAQHFETLRFTIRDSSGAEVPLVPGGNEKRVTFANRFEYCELCDTARLQEFDVQVRR